MKELKVQPDLLTNLISAQTNINMSLTMSEAASSQCPLSKSVPNIHSLRFCSHAQNLSQEGVGPISRMIKESLIEEEMSNPDLPDLHAAEGAKFAAMARRIAPVDLISAQLAEHLSSSPFNCMICPDNLYHTFASILKSTADSPEWSSPNQKKFHYTYSETCAFLKSCSSQPVLLLACYYLSEGLQDCINDLASQIDNETVGRDVQEFGSHFASANMLIVLPMALHLSLIKLKGSEADPSELDRAIITDAMKNLHDTGRFFMRVNGMSNTTAAGKVATFQCPMEGYLYSLICGNEVLEKTIAAMVKADSELLKSDTDSDIDNSAMHSLMIHLDNRETVKAIATNILKSM